MIFGDMGTREATREVLGAWLEKNEEKPFLRVFGMMLTARQYREALEQGRAEGREEGRAEWLQQAQDWYNPGEAAHEKDEN